MTDPVRLRRLARAQAALAEVAAARAALAARAYADSLAEADAIVAALNSRSALHGIAVPTMAAALKRNGRTTARLEAEAAAAAAQHRRDDRAAEALDERAREATRLDRAAARRRQAEDLGAAWKRRS